MEQHDGSRVMEREAGAGRRAEMCLSPGMQIRLDKEVDLTLWYGSKDSGYLGGSRYLTSYDAGDDREWLLARYQLMEKGRIR